MSTSVQGTAGIPQAQRCFQDALMLQPKSARAWRGLGDAAREGGDHQKAVELYSEVIPPPVHLPALRDRCSRLCKCMNA